MLVDGESGQCHVRRRTGPRLETATFATTVWHLDAIERKPLYHFRPGAQALTLAAPGCSFRCGYCQNHRLSQYGRSPESPWSARPVDLDEVIASAAAADAAIAFSYSEPTLAAELTLALADRARGSGVELVWKTNGFITPEALDVVAPHLAAVNVDLKAIDETRHRGLTGAPLAPVLDAIGRFVRAGVWVEISTPLIPGVNADDDSIARLAETITRISPKIPWHLVRFMPDHRMRSLPPTSPGTLERAAALARQAGLQFVYVERALGLAGRNTQCPRCCETVVRRDIWRTIGDAAFDGQCPRCNHTLPGRWKPREKRLCPPTASFATSLT